MERYIAQEKLKLNPAEILPRTSVQSRVSNIAPEVIHAAGSDRSQATEAGAVASSRARAIDAEFAPKSEPVRIGIELEGVGTVQTTWEKKSHQRMMERDEEENFHDVFKRTPLVRSKSFDEGVSRGVYIVPEDVDKTYGTFGPAELVSAPHLLDISSLNHLRHSVKKALTSGDSPMRGRTQNAVLHDPRLEPSDDFNAAQMTASTRWGKGNMTKVSGSLQTTMGVAVSNLLSDVKNSRIQTVELLIGDPEKRQRTRDLLLGAICIEQCLTRTGGPLEAYAPQSEGIRFAAFMHLVNFFGPKEKAEWGKDSFGAHFKGGSSFVGCGVADSNDILKLALQLPGTKDKATLMTEIVAKMEDNGLSEWVSKGIASKKFNLEKMGQPGLSMQTTQEDWYSIPNFLQESKLYTVVESREKTSNLNQKMVEFLNGNGDLDSTRLHKYLSNITQHSK
ncbi:hypothetical protein PS880_02968 [Pseudomonas fluorescens]|uniref:Uncharacterized protein n=2 Tax=Pseudomonas fluorescens TaxID=294 RepID=A0A5E7KSY6_PSEFL|nr:hypothetical protein PS880_02968 [Pseudomonas fluorescens]